MVMGNVESFWAYERKIPFGARWKLISNMIDDSIYRILSSIVVEFSERHSCAMHTQCCVDRILFHLYLNRWISFFFASLIRCWLDTISIRIPPDWLIFWGSPAQLLRTKSLKIMECRRDWHTFSHRGLILISIFCLCVGVRESTSIA